MTLANAFSNVILIRFFLQEDMETVLYSKLFVRLLQIRIVFSCSETSMIKYWRKGSWETPNYLGRKAILIAPDFPKNRLLRGRVIFRMGFVIRRGAGKKPKCYECGSAGKRSSSNDNFGTAELEKNFFLTSTYLLLGF